MVRGAIVNMIGLDLQIEHLRQEMHSDYIDAICEFAAQNNTDVEDLVKELHFSTKEKIKVDFIKRNMVRGQHLETSMEDYFE